MCVLVSSPAELGERSSAWVCVGGDCVETHHCGQPRCAWAGFSSYFVQSAAFFSLCFFMCFCSLLLYPRGEQQLSRSRASPLISWAMQEVRT